MKVKEIAFVCYAVKNLKVAREFYEGTLGLKATSTWVSNDTSGMIEYDIGSGTLAIGAGAPNFTPGKEGPCVALEVENFEEAVKELKTKKIEFVMEPMDTSVCQMALILDPDGNQLTIHRRKSK